MLNVSFFSYKGGAGRTSVLYNTLPFLCQKLHATENHPIVVLDLDIDSRGLTYLIDGESPSFHAVQVLKGEIPHNLRLNRSINDHPFFSRLQGIGNEVGLPANQRRAVLFVPAPIDSLFDAPSVSLRKLKEICEQMGCKAIVMDTPAGNQLSASSALSISQKVVTVMRITKQFNIGTSEFLRSKSQYNDKEFIIVPNAVPPVPIVNGEPKYDMSKIILRIAKNAELSLKGTQNTLNLSLIKNGLQGINEVNSFKFTESNLQNEASSRSLTDDELQAIKMFELLAEEIIK